MTGPSQTTAKPKAAPARKPATRGQKAENPRLEAEARQAADRVAARRPAPALTGRAPAQMPGQAGTATRLPATVQVRLEQSFNTDLSGLRVHTGPQASDLARMQGARAFAAGAHLVFADGAYRPHDGQGLRLIAHETAHALQQGRSPQPGGTAKVQRTPEPEVPGPAVQAGEGMVVNGKKTPDIWPLIVTNYKNMKTLGGEEYDPKDKRFADDLEAFEKALDGGALHLNTKTTASGKLATMLRSYNFRSFRGLCMGFDLLANSGEHKDALRHLQTYLHIEQLGYNKAFGDYYRAHADKELMAKRFLDEGASPHVKKQWEAFAKRVESWLLDPAATPPSKSTILGNHGDKTVQESYDKLKLNQAQYDILSFMQSKENKFLEGMRDPSGLSHLRKELGLDENKGRNAPMYVRYLMRVSVIDQNLLGRRTGDRTETGGRKDTDPKGDVLGRRLTGQLGVRAQRIYSGAHDALGLANRLASLGARGAPAGNEFKTAPDLDPGKDLKDFLTAIGKAMDKSADNSVLHLKKAPDGKADKDTEPKDKPGTPAEMQAQIAFYERLPSGPDFAKARGKLAEAVDTARAPLAEKLMKAAIRPQSSGDTVKLDRRNTLLMAMLWADWLVEWLRTAPVPDTKDSVAQSRYLIANAVGLSARALGHAALRKTLADIYRGGELGFSYAVIPHGFKEREGADLTDLKNEVNWVQVISGSETDTPYIGKLAVSTRNIVRFYQYTQLAAEIAVLKDERKKLDKVAERRLKQNPYQEAQERKKTAAQAAKEGREVSDVPNLNKLLKEAREKVNRPRLFEAKDGHLVMHPDDKSATAPKVQMRHPAMPALLGKKGGVPNGQGPIFKDKFLIRQEAGTDRVYFWSLPSFDAIWNELLTIPEITGLLADFRSEVTLPADASATAKLLTLMKWVEDETREGNANKEKSKELQDKLDTFFKDKKTATQDRMTEELRKLTIVNRKIALDNLRDYLWAFGDDTRKILLPGEFGEILSSFSHVVRPTEDRDRQVVALIFDAVDELETVVNKTAKTSHPSHSAIHNLLPPVQLAISFVRGESVAGILRGADLKDDEDIYDQATNLAKLDPFTPRYNDLDARYTRLKGIMRTLLEARAKSQKTWTLYGSSSEGLHTELSSKNIKPGEEWSSFVLALWSERDAENGSEGLWKWGEPAQERTTKEGETASKPEPLYKTILGTNHPVFYRIDRIHRGFEFVPPFDRASPESATARYPGTEKTMPGETELVTFSVAYLKKTDDGDMDMTRLRTVTVRAQDVELMTLLSAVIDTHARNAQLTELARGIEAGVEFALDMAEFIPGYGQAIMVARMAAKIAQMINEGELEALKADLIDTPMELMEFITEDVLSQLDGTLLWKFLLVELFGSGAAQTMSSKFQTMADRERKPKKAKKSGSGKGKGAKYAQLAKAVGGIGGTFVKALLKAQNRAGAAVNAATGKLATMPRVAPHLADIDRYYAYAQLIMMVADSVGDAKAAIGNDPRAAIGAKLADMQKGFQPDQLKEQLATLLTDAANIELPDEVVPTALLVEVAIEFLMTRINKKARFVYKALRLTGQLPRLAKLVEEQLISNTAADPNVYWRSMVRDKLREPFQDGRDALVTELFATLNAVFPGHPVKAPTLPDVAINNAPLELPEMDGFNLPGDPRSPFPGPLPDSAGRPLEASDRKRLENDFGHDLGHVRLHDGPDAAGFVDRTGAEALASGSHVYLGPDHRPGSQHGDHVMRHEIAHVLQQTGPRPMEGSGTPPADRPVAGRPGRGVQFDTAREAGAEEMAHASRNRLTRDGGPVPVRGRGPVAMAPFGRMDAIEMMRKLGETAGKGDYAAEMLKKKDYINKTKGKTARATADRLVGEVKTKLGSAAWTGSRPSALSTSVLGMVRDEVQVAITNGTTGHKPDLDYLVARAVTLMPASRRKGKKAGVDIYDLNEAAYVNIMAGYIYDMSGVLIDVKLSKTDPKSVVKVELESVHLGRVRGIGNPKFYQELKRANPDGTPTGFTFGHARNYYKTAFPDLQSWEKKPKTFVIPDADKKEIADFAKTEAKLDKDKLRPWDEYKNPQTSPLGLRVGLHGELSSKSASFDNTERESHHVPQFLFAEFFSSTNDNDAVSIWGADGSFWTPGFVPKGKSAAETERPAKQTKAYDKFNANGGALDLTRLSIETNRGASMPAVSLAADTHKRGKLHLAVEPSPDNDPLSDNQNSKSQGYYMSRIYRDFLVAEVKSARASIAAGSTGNLDDAASFKGLVTTAVSDSDPAPRQALEKATYKAMQASYNWMVGYMWTRLEGALDTRERRYYTDVSLKRQPEGTTDLPANDPYTPETGTDWIGSIKTALAKKNKEQFGTSFVSNTWGGGGG